MKLQQKYSLTVILLMALSATIGSSLLISVPYVAQLLYFNVWFMIVAWIIGGLLVLAEICLLAEAAISFPKNGSAYYWLKQAGWNGCAFWFGWILVLMVSATAISTACLAFAEIFNSLLTITNPWVTKAVAMIMVLLVTIIHIFFKRGSSISQIFFAVFKFLPIILIIILTIFYGSFTNITNNIANNKPTNKAGLIFALMPAVAITMFAYSGIESITYVSEEFKNKKRYLITALFLATLIVIIVYLVVSICLLMLNGQLNKLHAGGNINNIWNALILNHSKIPFAWTIALSISLILLYIGSVNAFLLYQSRLVFKMSEEKDLFQVFSKTHKKTNIPYAAMLLLIAFASFYVFWDQLSAIASYFIVAVSFLKLIVITVIIKLRLKNLEYQKLYGKYLFLIIILFAYLGAFLGIAGAFVALYQQAQASANNWIIWRAVIIFFVMLGGYPCFYLKQFYQNNISKKK